MMRKVGHTNDAATPHPLFCGRTALITGGSGGLGQHLVKRCMAFGMNVVAVSRSRPNNFDNSDLLPSTARLDFIETDLIDQHGVRALVAALAARRIHVDLLVNCAGRGLLSPFASIPVEDQRVLARLNFEVPVELTHALLPTLQARRGAVLNIGSLAAFMPLPNLSVLGASKAALLHWSVALRRELMGSVSVTAFCPGITKTPFLRTAKMDHLRLDERFFASEPAVVARRALDAVANNRAVAFATTLDTVSATIASFVPPRLAAALVHSTLKPSR